MVLPLPAWPRSGFLIWESGPGVTMFPGSVVSHGLRRQGLIVDFSGSDADDLL